jgi:hypothetical protein
MITLPPPTWCERTFQRAMYCLLRLMRRTDRLGFRQVFNPLLREPIACLVQWVMNLRRRNENFELAEERLLPDEEASTDSIIEAFATYMRRHYRPGEYERGGNTKTHGIVKATFTVHGDLPPELRKGVFAEPRTTRPGYASPGPAPTCRRISTMSASSAARSR